MKVLFLMQCMVRTWSMALPYDSVSGVLPLLQSSSSVPVQIELEHGSSPRGHSVGL